MTDRIFKDWIGYCVACNRQLNGPETTRTFRNSDELVGLCNHCIRASKSNQYAYEFVQEHCSEGETGQLSSASNHNDFWLSWFD